MFSGQNTFVRTAIVALALLSAFASAADDGAANKESAKPTTSEIHTIDADPIGRPKSFRSGKKIACLIWYAEGSWHLLLGARGKQHTYFQGSVEVDRGEIIETDTSGFDQKNKKRNTDWVTLDRNKKGLKFLFRNGGYTEGFSFKVSESARNVKFAVSVDRETSPDRVMIGKKKVHPSLNPFWLPAHPQGMEDADDPAPESDEPDETDDKPAVTNTKVKK
jgi:hypothetical protein